MRRADERCEQLNQVVIEMQRRIVDDEKIMKDLEGKIKVRDDEILRLHDLYLPVQNLEKINLKYQYEQNEQSVAKLHVMTSDVQQEFVSRAGQKLQAALDAFTIDVRGKSVLDVGASTGGFTDCCLRAGAAAAVGADWRLGHGRSTCTAT